MTHRLLAEEGKAIRSLGCAAICLTHVPGALRWLEHSVNLAERVARVKWYHTMELPGGIVTPGRYDTRAVPRRLPFPASLTGMRCLDVGTADGFWAFEMERRDAHEVV